MNKPLSGLLTLLFSGPLIAAVITVNTALDEPNGTVNGNCTLREAVAAANNDAATDGCAAGSGADQIEFSGAYTIGLLAQLNVNSELSINEPTPTQPVPQAITLDGGGAARAFRLGVAASQLTLTGMTIQNGSGGSGGAIEVASGDASFSASFVTFDGNQASANGGAISSSGDLALSGVIFTNNSATGSGGAVSMSGTDMVISGGFFGNVPASGNHADQNGGALHIVASGSLDRMVIDGAVFAFNTADGSGAERGGGAIWADTSNSASFVFQVDNAVFLNNETPNGAGGALLATSSSRIAYVDPLLPYLGGISRSHFEGNTVGGPAGADGAGGAIYNRGTMTIVASSFVGNTSDNGPGGAVAHNPGTDRSLLIANTTFNDNTAGSNGGALASLSTSAGTVTLINTTIAGNHAQAMGGTPGGGGLFNNNNTPEEFALGNSVISDNQTAGNPGNCAGKTFQDDGGNLQFGAGDCGILPSGDPQLDAPIPDPTTPNPLVWTMQPMNGSAVHGAGVDALCNAGPINKLDARNAARPMGGGACDSGAYESNGQYLPPNDVIFADDYSSPVCLDSDSNGPDFEAGALGLGTIDDCAGSTLSISGILGTTSDVDYFRFDGIDAPFCNASPTLSIATTRQMRTCVYYFCDSGTTGPVNCPGASSATSSLGLPGCCTTGKNLSLGNVNCIGTVDDSARVVIMADQSIDNCAEYTIQAEF